MTADRIQVLVFEPGKPSELREIDNDLGALQAIVGGYVEMVRLPALTKRGLALFANEDGRLQQLPANRCGLVGTFFIARVRSAAFGEDFVSLEESDAEHAEHVLLDAYFE